MKNLLALLALFVAPLSLLAAEVPKLKATEAAKLVADGKAVLVDVREASEWKENGVAAPAVLLPKSDFDGDQKQWKEFLAKNGDKQVVLYCRSGRRADAVGAALQEKGIKVANVGGLKDWKDAGLPTRTVEEKSAK